ncbi:MAG: amino acid-binding protein [Bacteroidales bacterium]|nr:amino acid-binding protein [Bacteroidales bacterium]
MTVQQISVFLENKSGSLVKVFRALSQAGIQLITSTLADTADYGVCRILCDNPDKAYSVLSQDGFSVTKTPVFAIALDDQPGRAADAIACFADGGISISYLYSFLYEGKGVLIFRTSDLDKAAALIAEKGLSEAKL